MALKEALQRGSIQSSPYQKQGNVKNSDQLHMFSENQKAYFVVKRSLDIVLSFLLLAVLSPIFIICALAIKLESSGSVIFRQERVGRGGEPFRVYKFRTMYKHTPNNVATNQFKNPGHYITKVGKILRVTSLDELPQLLNVLKRRNEPCWASPFNSSGRKDPFTAFKKRRIQSSPRRNRICPSKRQRSGR